MASITVRGLDEQTFHRLRIRAARHERFAALGGVELDIPPRDGAIRVVEFD